IPRHPVVVAQQKPRDVVDDVMQPRDDERAIEHAIHEEPGITRAEHGAAHRIHTLLEKRPTPTEQAGEDETDNAARDRYEAPPAKKREIARHANVAIAIVENAAEHAGDDAGRHAELRELFRFEGSRGEIARLPRE